MKRLQVVVFLVALVGCSEDPSTTVPAPGRHAASARGLEKAGSAPETEPVLTNSIAMKLVLIPPGEFVMGSPPDEEQRTERETQHRVRLTKGFYMGSTEVSQGQWKALMGENPSFFVGEALPVETVTWEDAVEFCRRLSEKEGAWYRLPTEAEWEYACRAGTKTPFHTGDTIDPHQANYNGNFKYGAGRKGAYVEQTTEVGSYPPNAWGLYDMHGNVWEWCADWYGEYPAGEVSDPKGPPTGEKRVCRGGCWINFPAVCRSANRGRTRPVSWNFHFGFRVVRELD